MAIERQSLLGQMIRSNVTIKTYCDLSVLLSVSFQFKNGPRDTGIAKNRMKMEMSFSQLILCLFQVDFLVYY